MIQKLILTNTDSLIPYAGNSRTHSDEQVRQIAASIKEFGFNNPVLIDEANGIIAGHGRVLAAVKLQIKEVPTICLKHLSDAQRRAYVIADNKLALNANWDQDALHAEIERLVDDGFDLDLTGFGEDEINDYLKTDEVNFEPGTEDDQGKLGELDPKFVKCPSCNHVFDSRNHEHNP